ncbi:hypothetical protein CIB48_g8965 [Xylaria polymorpha]|nr:hypothetical protein CIB48_g8965 [Xylaria polymorpha]
MQFTTSFITLLAAAVASAAPSTQAGVPIVEGGETIASNSWAMQTWTGTSCQGTQLFWSVPDGFSCTNLGAVSSLKVTNFGGCSTTYFTGSGCQAAPSTSTPKVLAMGTLRVNALGRSLSSVKQLQKLVSFRGAWA